MPTPPSMTAVRLHAAHQALSLDVVPRPTPTDHDVYGPRISTSAIASAYRGWDRLVGSAATAAGTPRTCEQAQFTGYTRDGGYAQYALADARYCFALPARYSDVEAAPLLCAGLIGYRAYRAAGDGTNFGLYGFGAAAHLLAQVAHAEGRRYSP